MIMVLLVFFVFTLLSMALLTLSLTSSTAATSETKSQQAYFTARSANNAAISALKNNTTLQGTIATLGTYSGQGSNSSMGSYTVNYYYDSPNNRIKITTTSNGAIVVSYVTVPLTIEKDYSNPFENVRFICGNLGWDSPHAYISSGSSSNSDTGDYVYYGVTSISGGAYIYGTLLEIAGGNNRGHSDLYISGALNGQSKANNNTLSTTGNLYLGSYHWNGSRWTDNGGNAAKIYVDIYVAGSLDIESGSTIGTSTVPVNVYVNGNVTVNNGTVYGNVYCGGNVTVNDSGNVKSGKIDAYGTVTNNSGYIQNVSTQNDTTMKSPCSIDFTKPDNMPTNIGYDSSDDNSCISITNSVPITDNGNNTATINTSGVLTTDDLGYYSFWSGYNSYYDSIVVDTGTNPDTPLRLILDKGSYSSFYLDTKLLVKGNNYLYIYLKNGTDLTLLGGGIGMKNGNTNSFCDQSAAAPKILILGNSQTITFNGSSGSPLLRAYIYIPNGKWAGTWNVTSRSSNPVYAFIGSAVIGNSNVAGTFKMLYMPSDLSSTPLKNIASGVYKTTTGSYKATGWSGS